MKVVTDPSQIKELLERGVDKIYPSKDALEKALVSGKKIKLYQGFDPTGDRLHIGHMIGLRKLAQWQRLGHEVIFLIGDGTGQAGDPSGKKTKREKFFTQKELRKNALTYVKQASKIVDFSGKNKIKVKYNGDWLNKLKLPELLSVLEKFTLAQLSERDLFRERAKNGEEVSMREFVYPVLQAYDSVAMGVDLEVGGSDQTFNMLCGRDLVKAVEGRDKFVMTTPLLADSQGRKIGKTEGNVIALTDSPEELFGKIMSLSDDVIIKGLEYLSDIKMDNILEMKDKMDSGENPITYKKVLAYDIVRQLHGEKKADKASLGFASAFQKKEIPEEVAEIGAVGDMSMTLVSGNICESRSEAIRLFKAGAVTDMNLDRKVSEKDTPVSGHVYRVGKHRFIKIK